MENENFEQKLLSKKFGVVSIYAEPKVSSGIYYCINGIEIGYLNLSPFEPLMLAIIIQTTFRTPKNAIIGIPIIIKHKGITSTIYSSMESWKFNDAFPFSLTQADSSLFDNQQISGPMIPPNGKKKPANAERWQSIAQFFSDSDNSLTSSIMFLVY